MGDEGNLVRAASPVTALGTEDRTLAATLQRAVHELQATTATAMVPLRDGRTLANVVVVGGPLSVFTVADRHPVDDDRYAGAVAYRTGRQCVRVRGETPRGVRPAMPFPYAWCTPTARSRSGSASTPTGCAWTSATPIRGHRFQRPCSHPERRTTSRNTAGDCSSSMPLPHPGATPPAAGASRSGSS